jgi:hypothetical protein
MWLSLARRPKKIYVGAEQSDRPSLDLMTLVKPIPPTKISVTLQRDVGRTYQDHWSIRPIRTLLSPGSLTQPQRTVQIQTKRAWQPSDIAAGLGPDLEIERMTTAQEMWKHLALNYTPTGGCVFDRVVQEIYTCRSTTKSVQEYARIDDSCKLTDRWLAVILMQGLGQGFDGFLTSFKTQHDLIKDVTFDLQPAISSSFTRIFADPSIPRSAARNTLLPF